MSTAMSTAFMVDSILQDKDAPSDQVSRCTDGSSPVGVPPGVSNGDAGSLASISDSDEFDEPKDSASLCDSPKSFHSLHHHHHHPSSDHHLHLHHHHHLLAQHHHHHHHHSSAYSDDEVPAGPPASINGASILRRPAFRTHPDDGVPLEQMDFCCAKCGHCQAELNPGSSEGEHNNNNTGGSKEESGPEGRDGGLSEFEFRCEKCGFGEYVVPGKQTILKESSKPVLKFSVSAILGDKKDCVKVRNDL
uniref:Uncharacterized protein n=1 Tax=Anopheles maculatus TaxID=74869 RepID=A0A182T1B9_9DIPT